ncbi:hypothetical protein [Amycolatopsis cihanbeyliensis]|uniref:Alpha/beta hydrolase family protein n=1 Tax=Amycolatopsis cihanbeyliensis TaxID=1128664 RepID=A0A542CT57_AMYCI|nr:hypothetical protein FB471_6120 [Amycolatopsis cihanbeyliensis]
MPVLAGAEPFAHTGPTGSGVLPCHGLAGTPASMRPRGAYLAESVRSTEFTEVLPRDSFHVATPDHDAPLVFERSLDVVRAHQPLGAPGRGPRREGAEA